MINLKEERKGKTSIGILKHFTKIKEEFEDLQREILVCCDFQPHIFQSSMGVCIILSMSVSLRKPKRGFISLKDMVDWYMRERLTNYLDFGVTKT